MATIKTRTRKDGSKSYLVSIRMKGHPPQNKTFRRLVDARRWIQDAESAIRSGRYFETTESSKHTLADLVERYIKTVLPYKSKTQCAKQAYQLNWWSGQIGRYTLGRVTPALIVECRDLLLLDRSPATTVRYMAALSHAFTVAVNEWGWLEHNPMRKVSRPKEPRGRMRFLSNDELHRLMQACKESDNSYLYPAFMLALATGARQGEIMGLTWQDVDLDSGRLVFHDTKNGERRGLTHL